MQIWILPLFQLTEQEYNCMTDMCTKERQNLIKRTKNVKTRIQKIGAGYLLSKLQEFLVINRALKMSELEVAIDERGKPYFKYYPAVKFNMSHTDRCVVLAWGQEEIGIDIETIRKEPEGVAKRFFHRKECEKIHENDAYKDILFFQYWTEKEAWLKLTGKGLSGLFSTYIIGSPPTAFREIDSIHERKIYISEEKDFIVKSDYDKKQFSSSKYILREYRISILSEDKSWKQLVISAITSEKEKLPERIIYSKDFAKEVSNNLSFLPETIIIKL